MYTIKLNPKFFKDYDSSTKRSFTADNMLYVVGPTSLLVEKTQVPYNSGKYYKHNQAELERCHCRTGAAPVWATVSGMWLDNVEFEIVIRSSVYPDLIEAVNTGKIIVEKDEIELSVDALLEMLKDESESDTFPKFPDTEIFAYIDNMFIESASMLIVPSAQTLTYFEVSDEEQQRLNRISDLEEYGYVREE